MTRKTNVQTNLLGRQAFLTQENADAAGRYQSLHLQDHEIPPYIRLHPDGGEIVAVYTDRDGVLNITLSIPGELVTVTANYLQVKDEDQDQKLKQRLDAAVAALNALMIYHHKDLPSSLAEKLTEADITVNGIRDALYDLDGCG